MSEREPQFDYPVTISEGHKAVETVDYGEGKDRFECEPSGAYTHTGAWPAFDFCPFCGAEL